LISIFGTGEWALEEEEELPGIEKEIND